MTRKTGSLYVALVHYPVLNRNGEVIASAVTNLDLHDLARASCTYDVPACYIVSPLEDQQRLAARLIGHWRERVGKDLHPDRDLALRRLHLVEDVAAARDDIEAACGRSPLLWATTARTDAQSMGHAEARRILAESSRPILLLLGTGWGLAPSVMGEVDSILEAIRGIDGYNHLSVRCAAAILLDRLLAAER
ncbi:RNA methyltransferase [Desulforhabdus sp. TSK]|uniref:RNA methyltransferase n=1 Tax=Desulforhabdus sp. TSK TaxID=2925014 RepID=UPI001FC853B2|nr:RNA methyltransferase [Desulforhabdus sp. TSK]